MAGTVTFINHATVLMQLNGINILTDPIYSRTVSFLFPRLQPPGIPFTALPPIHLVLLSHSDYDHLNRKTLKNLSKYHNAPLIVPTGLAQHGRTTGFREVVELKHWQNVSSAGVTVTCVPAKHKSKRTPGDPSSFSCAGFVVETGSHTVYFAGDTAYDEFFSEIGRRFTIDVALLPIGAYKPETWFKNLHLHRATAIQAFLDLNAQLLVPIHWGTFWISDEPMAEPPKLLLAEAGRRGCADRVRVLKNGESLQLG